VKGVKELIECELRQTKRGRNRGRSVLKRWKKAGVTSKDHMDSLHRQTTEKGREREEAAGQPEVRRQSIKRKRETEVMVQVKKIENPDQ
jgi:hypothetical protein